MAPHTHTRSTHIPRVGADVHQAPVIHTTGVAFSPHCKRNSRTVARSEQHTQSREYF